MNTTKEQSDAIVCGILKNLASEAEARKLQQELLSLPGLDAEDVYRIMEISGDEANHALIYEAMYKKYSGVTAASDGMKQALASIGEGVKDGG